MKTNLRKLVQEELEKLSKNLSDIATPADALKKAGEITKLSTTVVEKANQSLFDATEEEKKIAEDLRKLSSDLKSIQKELAQTDIASKLTTLSDGVADSKKLLEQSKENLQSLVKDNAELKAYFSAETLRIENLVKANGRTISALENLAKVQSQTTERLFSNLEKSTAKLKDDIDTNHKKALSQISNTADRLDKRLSNISLLIQEKIEFQIRLIYGVGGLVIIMLILLIVF